MDDLRDRLANRVQLTSDGHKAYLEAVDGAFGGDIDYAMLVKFHGATSKGAKGRYSPAECIGARKMPISSNGPVRVCPRSSNRACGKRCCKTSRFASKLLRDVRCSTDFLQIPEILNQKNASVSIGVGLPDR
jgi:hypothetical protein